MTSNVKPLILLSKNKMRDDFQTVN